jgi:FKBP-type peptidyl-prolyl cis-trans isomerase
LSKKQRFAWLFLTALFIFTGVGLGAWAFWVDTHPSKDDQSQTPTQTNQKQENKLKGTQLANFTPVAKVDTLQKIDTTAGTGDEAKASSTVTVSYTGAIASTGIIFESSLDNGGQPVTFPLNQVIKGWQEGIPGMKTGGTRRLLIPSALAYGTQGSGAIPPNSDLVFDVTLLSVK